MPRVSHPWMNGQTYCLGGAESSASKEPLVPPPLGWGSLLWIIFGALAGWIASLIMNTDAEQGTLLNIIVGIVGSVVGGYLFQTFGQTGVTGFNIYSLLVAVIGSMALLGIVKIVRQ